VFGTFCWCSCLNLAAQTGIVVLNTGGGQLLVSETRGLSADPTLVLPAVEFNFGFATDEAIEPSVFLDSFTVTAQDGSSNQTALLLTIDADSLVIAPPAVGTLSVDPSGIRAYDSAYPSLVPVLAQRQGFQARALLPPQLAGRPINIYFDLFDNLDGRKSQAWFSEPKIVSAPLLTLTASGTNNFLLLSWASPSTGFVLQQNPNLAGSNWTDVAQAPVDDGRLKTIPIDPSIGMMFFRLKQK
jgi:hypothetical protein